ncbi:hypothetical protein PM082_008944 [Marasmius tenuissimus]|nr:hypothetical protein PM082_008944 [Marasmius tenuissimus]
MRHHKLHTVRDLSSRETPERAPWSGDQSASTTQRSPWESDSTTNSEMRKRKTRTPATVTRDSAYKHKNISSDVYGVNDQRSEVYNGPVTINNNHYAYGRVYNASRVGMSGPNSGRDANHPVQNLPIRANRYPSASSGDQPTPPILNSRAGHRSRFSSRERQYDPRQTEAGPSVIPFPPYYHSESERRREPSKPLFSDIL